MRRQLDRERYSNWERRQRDFFGGYSTRPVVVYRDPYSSFFWWWLLDQSLDTRARWAYTHRHAMDENRYRDLLAKDAQLEAKIRELENQNAPRDPSWTPTGIEPDLVYKKEYVEEAKSAADAEAAPNPVVIPETFPRTEPYPEYRSSPQGPNIGSVLMTIGIVAFLIWLVFFKRWGV